jgi:hypothetical protein
MLEFLVAFLSHSLFFLGNLTNFFFHLYRKGVSGLYIGVSGCPAKAMNRINTPQTLQQMSHHVKATHHKTANTTPIQGRETKPLTPQRLE